MLNTRPTRIGAIRPGKRASASPTRLGSKPWSSSTTILGTMMTLWTRSPRMRHSPGPARSWPRRDSYSDRDKLPADQHAGQNSRRRFMTASHQATQFGRSIQAPNEAWLAKQPPEPILEPDLPIIDTHHHFWDRATDRPGHRYLLDELLADLNTGHNIVATVFLECRSMLRPLCRQGRRGLRVLEAVDDRACGVSECR